MPARTRTITCKNCNARITLTKGKGRKTRTGPKDPNNVARGRLLAKFSAANRARTGRPGPFTRQQKNQLARIPKARKRGGRPPKIGAQPPIKRQTLVSEDPEELEEFEERFATRQRFS